MNMQESWLNGDGMTRAQEEWSEGKENKDDKGLTTEEFLWFITDTLEKVEDPKLIADLAVGAIMTLVKRLMDKEIEDDLREH